MKFEEFKKAFCKGNSDKRYLIYQIKDGISDFQTLKKFISRFRKEIKFADSLLNQELVGHDNLPKKYTEIKSKKSQSYTNSLIKEINWFAVGFIENFELINTFIFLRDLFEKELMLGNYEEARTILNRIEDEVSLSVWTIENRFILDEYQYGSEKNWEYRNTIVDDQNDIFIQVLGNMFSLKSESRISFFQYNELYNQWEEAQQLIEQEYQGLVEYFRFRGNFFLSKNYLKYSELLFYDSNSTLIDRYLIFIRAIQQLFTEGFDENYKILICLKELKTVIKDIALKQLILVQDENWIDVNNDNSSSDVIIAIDLYTEGKYSESKEKCLELIINGMGNVPELYEIYVKALIENGDNYEQITSKDSFVNSITKLYFDTLSKTANSDDVFIELLKFAYTFNNSGLGLNIYEFVKDELGWTNDINYGFLAHLNSKFLNPKILNHIHDKPLITKNIIANLNLLFPNSSTVSVYSEFYDNFFKNLPISFFEHTPSVKSEIYKLRWLMLKKRYSECILPYRELLKKELSAINNYEIINALFECYLMNNDPRSNIILYVDSYLKNPQLTKKFNTSDLIISISSSKFKNLGDKTLLIELPIFFKLLSTEKIKVKQACELFLASNGFTKPSELLVNSHVYDKQKLTYFLSLVCTIEILQLSKFYESTYDVNEERIKICQFLANFDMVNRKTYNTEIALLTQRNTISKVIGKIDEGKIYVNEEKIKQIFLKTETKNDVSKIKEVSGDNYLTKEFFLRTMDLKKFVANNEYKKTRRLFFIDIDEKGNVNNNPAFDDFKKMFLELRNYFVWSKEYGLDAYLSTRIRHGTLVNHIRSVFELFNLVTTQVDGNYAENNFWNEKIKGDNTQIQTLLSNFSKNIDLILISLKEEAIQCKTEQVYDKFNGLFDFSYLSDFQLMILYISETESYEDFLNLCFDELWSRTDHCLDIIKIALDEEIKEGFVHLLNKLEEDLVKDHKKPVISDLLSSLNLCRTEIQTKMNNVIKWFNRSENTFEGEYNLEVLIDTSVQITKNTHPTYDFKIEKNIAKQIMISGESHQHIIDLINNCLFNMIKHSSLETQDLKAKIEITEHNNFLELNFINNVNNADDHIAKLTKVKDSWLQSDLNITKEEGTGFPKIKKIIHSDLGRKDSKFDFKFEKNLLTLTLSFEINDLKV